jgi:HD superfamily phosphodiesterase
MDKRVYDESVKILIEYFKDNIDSSQNKYCNSDSWMFCIKHSLRVENYAARIKDNFDSLSMSDIYTLQAAAIFHDIGNVVQRENHGEIGAEIVKKFFDNTEFLSKCGINKDRLIHIIANHSNKENESDRDLVSVILKDADILDQIGAMSILMQGTKHNYNSYEYYHEVLEDLRNKELPYCEKEYLLLKTNPGKKIMDEKMKLIKDFEKQLENEISGEMSLSAINLTCSNLDVKY